MIRKIFESRNHSGWLIISVVIVMIGMFCSIFIPVMMTLLRFQTNTKVGYSPNEGTIWVQLLAFVCLAAGIYFVYKLTKKSVRILSGIIGMGLFAFVSFIAFNLYIYIDYGYIEVGNGLSSTQYEWEQVESAKYYETFDGIESYVLTMDDHKEVEVVFGGLLNSAAKLHIMKAIEDQGIKIEDLS